MANGAIVKHWFCCALVLAVLSSLFSITPAACQEIVSSPASDNAAIPDTPSVTQATTCTERNGKPCPEWVHKLIGQYPPLPESATTQLKRDPSSVHFWTYRGLEEPPLRTNKEVFRSKLFIATHIGGALPWSWPAAINVLMNNGTPKYPRLLACSEWTISSSVSLVAPMPSGLPSMRWFTTVWRVHDDELIPAGATGASAARRDRIMHALLSFLELPR